MQTFLPLVQTQVANGIHRVFPHKLDFLNNTVIAKAVQNDEKRKDGDKYVTTFFPLQLTEEQRKLHNGRIVVDDVQKNQQYI